MKISARLLVRLYPRAWRARYGEEFLALVGERADWRTAMDVAKSAVSERIEPAGAVDRKSIGRALTMAMVAYVGVLTAIAVIQVALLADRLGFKVALTETVSSVSHVGRGAWLVWMMFALGAVLIGMIASRVGWSARRPVLARNCVRFGVFVVVASLEVATAPPLARISPFSLQQLLALDLMTLLIGFIVARAMFGPRQLHTPQGPPM